MTAAVLADTTWPDVALALVPTIAATVAGVLSYLNRRALNTPNGSTVGELVEHAHRQAEVTNVIVKRTLGERREDARSTPKAVTERIREGDGEP